MNRNITDRVSAGRTEFSVRPWQPADIPELRDIFAASFGDPPEVIDAFHRAFLNTPEACVLAAVPETGRPEGRAVAAGYCLPGPTLRFSESESCASAYLYALGCLPEMRGRGIGMAVYREMLIRSAEIAPASCIIPATEALVRAYNRVHPMMPLGRSRIAEMSGAEAAAAAPVRTERIGWEEYARRREEVLAACPHAVYPESYGRLMSEFGHIFLTMPGALGAAIPLEDRCIVTELLCTGTDPGQAVAGIAAVCPAEHWEIRTPVFLPGPGTARCFAYYPYAAEGTPAPEEFWYPFGLE